MKHRVISFFAILLALSLTACSKTTQPAKQVGNIEIVTSFYTMYVFTMNIVEGVDGVTVHNMTKPNGGCLHDYQLLPVDLKRLGNADAFVINGAGMENFADKVIQSLPDLKIIEASQGFDLIENESGHSHGSAHADERPGDEEYNSHVWLSPNNAVKEIYNIAEGLAQIDLAHAEQYRRNAAVYEEKIIKLWEELKLELSPHSGEKIIVSHEAFDYLTQEIGIEIIGSVRSEENSGPPAKELVEFIIKAETEGVAAIFAEPQYSCTALDIISRELGIRIYTLDPMVTGDENEYKDVYENTMIKNVNALKQAFSQ